MVFGIETCDGGPYGSIMDCALHCLFAAKPDCHCKGFCEERQKAVLQMLEENETRPIPEYRPRPHMEGGKVVVYDDEWDDPSSLETEVDPNKPNSAGLLTAGTMKAIKYREITQKLRAPMRSCKSKACLDFDDGVTTLEGVGFEALVLGSLRPDVPRRCGSRSGPSDLGPIARGLPLRRLARDGRECRSGEFL
eukprot:TRINITY_DN2485_c0_g2_i1.p1 TRINITY_DN2485_c0_g2~~TRINITY_DN2485_c0_g2_i1.p1  ORF type:complete len:193 (+),score=39.94 TRINITY_DN2485_c0_g2_i1:159-737(+)